ncbi:hypothetical protein PsorP6_015416 [Peronosclerospora sorghi]|uniref:Uncharacterized protein n=1 Tax=Peronosclerospora sorghi TaxID=230839 RepID=A0ACC0WNW0_9STRA|nr:hypothetical protein PsorP6_015416 [Peronosclerospora sorghi]
MICVDSTTIIALLSSLVLAEQESTTILIFLQVSLFSMKRYSCQCKSCGCRFTQNVQKGVVNAIATKILSLAYENVRNLVFVAIQFHGVAI